MYLGAIEDAMRDTYSIAEFRSKHYSSLFYSEEERKT